MDRERRLRREQRAARYLGAVAVAGSGMSREQRADGGTQGEHREQYGERHPEVGPAPRRGGSAFRGGHAAAPAAEPRDSGEQNSRSQRSQ
jgi:hypothetical protein